LALVLTALIPLFLIAVLVATVYGRGIFHHH